MSRIRRGSLAALGLALLLAACRLAGQQPLSTTALPSSPPAATPQSTPASAAPTPGGMLSSPGAPYDVDAILDAMAASRRPGGVPEVLQNRQVAASIAHAARSWDGNAWETLSISASCGPERCSVELAGEARGGAGTDLYSFSVDPEARRVELLASDLHGYPATLEADLDAVARAALDPKRLDGLALVSARWLPPPDTDRYLLAYRSGGEEGAPRLDILLDLATGEVLDVTEAP
jgi:hypothetical protein